MSSIGVHLKIDVTKIDKELLFEGKKGKYLDATVFINPDEANEYGDHGMIRQDVSKEAREAGEKGAILGNARVFWQGEGKAQNQSHKPQSTGGNGQDAAQNFDNFPDDSVPF